MNHPECIITGCEFMSAGGYVHGDLHQLGDVYIFNAATGAQGNMEWAYGPPHKGAKVLWDSCGMYFERRGVIIIAKAGAILNQAAQDYLTGGPRACRY